jgi:Astacin (Peptidase family M12A)
MADFIPCTPRRLETRLLLAAARTACEHNPANRPAAERALVTDPQYIALLTTKYWGAGGVKLGVYFMDTQDTTLKNRILAHMNAWGPRANVVFQEASAHAAQVRIARQRGGGYWSYLGTDILHIPYGQPTMNLDSFSNNTPESEYSRVVRHETGHTLGFPHEHMRREIVQRLDPQKTISYFMRTQGWSAQEVQAQVLTPLEDVQLKKTPQADVISIMCYQLPGEITVDGQPIAGGNDIDESDFAFAADVYPRPEAPPPPPPPPGEVTITVPRAGTYRLVR